MNNNIEGIGSLEKPVGTLKILVHLKKHEKATITGLIKDANLSQKTAYSALNRLQNNGLIYQTETNSFPLCKYYLLTDKGCEIAKHLQMVAFILAQEYDE